MNDTVTFYSEEKANFIAIANNTDEEEGWFYEAFPLVDGDYDYPWWGVRVFDEEGIYVGNL